MQIRESTKNYSFSVRKDQFFINIPSSTILIRVARKERKLSVKDVADRVGVSRGLMQRIEKGDLKCEIGVAFEAASILGIKLFETQPETVSDHLRQMERVLTLLPNVVPEGLRHKMVK